MGITAFLMRDAKPSLARYVYILGTSLAGFLVTIVHLKAIFQGVENNMSWLIVLLTSIITVWAAMLVWKEDKAVLQQMPFFISITFFATKN